MMEESSSAASASRLRSLPNPFVKLVRLPPPSEQKNQSSYPTSRPRIPSIINTSNIISVILNSNGAREDCLFCGERSPIGPDKKLISKPTRRTSKKFKLTQTFCKLFNASSTTFNQRSLISCTSCTKQLDNLYCFDKQLEKIAFKLGNLREQLMNIILKNYISKATDLTTQSETQRNGNTEEETLVDQLFQGWKLSLNQEQKARASRKGSGYTRLLASNQKVKRKPTDKTKRNPRSQEKNLDITKDLDTEMEMDQESEEAPLVYNNTDKHKGLMDIEEEIVMAGGMENCSYGSDNEISIKEEVDLDHLLLPDSDPDENWYSNIASVNKQDEDIPVDQQNPVPLKEEEEQHPSGQFECRFCKKLFKLRGKRNKHEKRQHLLSNSNIYHCQFCSKEIKTLGTFLLHVERNHVAVNEQQVFHGDNFTFYSCDGNNCNLCYASQDLLEEHIQEAHTTTFTCQICHHLFAQRTNLDNHLKNVHSNSNSNGKFSCKYCHLDFNTKCTLEYHETMHTVKIIPFEHKCNICGESYRMKYRLWRHKSQVHKIRLAGYKNRKQLLEKEEMLKQQAIGGYSYFQCKVCDKKLPNWRSYSLHLTIHDKNHPGFHCQICGAVFQTIFAKFKHQTLVHRRPKCRFCNKEVKYNCSFSKRMHEYKCDPQEFLAGNSFLCKICFLCFVNEQNFNLHQKEVHEPTKCNICNAQLTNKRSFASHLKLHSSAEAGNTSRPITTATCELCNITFQKRSLLVMHDSVLHSERPRNNEFCSSSTRGNSVMSDPDPPYFTPLKTRPTMKRPHNCNYGCGKAFPRPYSQRKHHVLYHPDLHLMQNNSVYCKICFEIFKDNTELTEHTDVQHNNSKQDQQLQCEECGKQFKVIYKLRDHKYIHLPNHDGFCCETCGKSFQTPSSLKAHIKQHLSNYNYCKAKCQYCGKLVPNGKPLNRHLYVEHRDKTMAHVCTVCYSTFDTETNLGLHLKNSHYKCQYCGHQFETKSKLNHHENIHTGNQPFECKICNKRFNNQANLYVHSIIHSGKKPYNCEICSAGFVRKKFLAEHKLKVHPTTATAGLQQ